MADDQHIFSEFLDLHRQKLIRNIIQQDVELAEIPRSMFFPLWFSDITVLEKLSAIRNTDATGFRLRTLQLTTLRCENWPRIFAAGKHAPKNELSLVEPTLVEPALVEPTKVQDRRKRPRAQSSSIDPEPYCQTSPVRPLRSSKPLRSSPAKHATLQRDENKCILTKHGRTTLEVAHIVPFKLHMTKRAASWNFLIDFWGVDKVNAWRAEILGNDGAFNTEKVQNMLCLGPALHAYWDMPICAFLPISINDELTSMDLAFHWLPLPNKSIHSKNKIRTMEHPDPKYPTGFCDGPGENIFLFNMETKSIILSGEIFTITTDDPKERPLPSFQLLEMQWNLSRIAAMQGAGEDDENDTDSDSDIVSVSSSSRSRSRSRSRFRSPEKEPVQAIKKENSPPP
ncbi:hypothetical protein N7509_013519 [Penicillium cosmopolitanum]|uniref:HNH nuclease domain-containing protein n=1 Tax=Penicillium cosmopolitanum TaxID=1131564 RepID=A0A9W9SI29_9EURO|nr:uncharacterized protein N7509_013519 [Penicillium cosmopolitanum]KAJ5376633.1 hypothetical protein N7509_013519 [Penicillium cosmopolitanum]